MLTFATLFLLYLIGIVGGLKFITGVLAFCLVFAGIIVIATWYDSYASNKKPETLAWGKKLVLWGIASALLCAMIPDRNGMITVAAGAGVLAVVNNESVQNVAGSAGKIIELQLSKYVSELEAEIENKKPKK